MTSAPALSLSYRKHGASNWVDIDPATEPGARVLKHLGLQIAASGHPNEEKEAMTATAIRRETTSPLRPVEGTSKKERFAWALRMKERIGGYAAAVTAAPRRLGGRIARALHLDTVWDWVKEGGNWVKDRVAWAAGMLGISGMLGLSAVTLSTGVGRSVVSNLVGRPLGWLGRGLEWAGTQTINGLDHLGSPGKWVGNRMHDIGVGFAKAAGRTYKAYNKHVAPHMDTKSTTMRVTRLGGVLLLAQRAMTAFGLPMPAVYLIAAVTAFWSVYDFADTAIQLGQKRGWVEVKETGVGEVATAKIEATVATPGAEIKPAPVPAKATSGAHPDRRRH